MFYTNLVKSFQGVFFYQVREYHNIKYPIFIVFYFKKNLDIFSL